MKRYILGFMFILSMLCSTAMAEDADMITLPGQGLIPDSYSGLSYNATSVVTTGTNRNLRGIIPVVEGDSYNLLRLAGNTNGDATATAYLKLLRNGAISLLGQVSLPANKSGSVEVKLPKEYVAMNGDAVFVVVVAKAYSSTSANSSILSVSVGHDDSGQ